MHAYSVYGIYAHITTSAHDQVCMEAKQGCLVSSFIILHSIPLIQGLSLKVAGNQQAPGILLSLSFMVLALHTPRWPHSAFYIGASLNLDLNLHACVTVDLTH